MNKLIQRIFGRGRSNGAEGSSTVPVTVSTVSPAAADFVADPYPLYVHLRENQPTAPLASGGYLLCRYQDVSAALTDQRLGNAPSRFSVLNARHAGRYLASAMAGRMPPFLDMPAHRLVRQALTRAFFRTLDPFAAGLEELAEEHVASKRGRFDLISAVASPYACQAMVRFVGLEAPPDALKPLTWAFFHLFAPVADGTGFAALNEKLAEGRALIGRSLQLRRTRPGADLLSELVHYQAQVPELSDDHIIDLAFLVAADGVENIEAGLALAVRRVLSEPGLREHCLAASSLDAVVRESLRLETPAQIIPRVAREPLALHGREIAPGVPVFLALGSANRDPRAFDQADLFKPGRSGDPLTFGLGRHRCIGEPLAVAMIAALLKVLLRHGIQQRRADRTFTYQARFGHRWPVAAMVSVPRS